MSYRSVPQRDIDSMIDRVKSTTSLTDNDTIMSVLVAHDYDVDATISYLYASTPSNNTNRRSTLNNNNTTTTRTTNTDTNTADDYWYNYIPGIYYVFSTFNLIKTLASYILPDGWITITGPSQPTPTEWVQSLIDRYNDSLPIIHNTTYPAAVRHAKTNNKMLLIYLHRETNPDCHTFINDTLCTESVRNYINENVILWCGNIIHPDGDRLSHTLHATQFPYLALLSTNVTGNQVALVYKYMGLIDSDTLIAQLLNAIETNTANIARQQQLQQQSSSSLQTNRDLIAAQDQEYLDALAADQQAKQQRIQQAQQLQQHEQLVQQQKLQQQQIELARQQHINSKKKRFTELPAEPVPSSSVIQIAIKLPSNKSYKRRFRSDDTMQSVFDYISTLDDDIVDKPHLVVSYVLYCII